MLVFTLFVGMYLIRGSFNKNTSIRTAICYVLRSSVEAVMAAHCSNAVINIHGPDKKDDPLDTGEQFLRSTSSISCQRLFLPLTRSDLRPPHSTSNAHVHPNYRLPQSPRRPLAPVTQTTTTTMQGSQALGFPVPQLNVATPSGPTPSLLTAAQKS